MAKASGPKKAGPAGKSGRAGSRGGFAIGLVAGLLIGLALALGVALYITKVPVPFVDKLPQRTDEQDQAEAERNRNWDPNKALAPTAQRPPAPASGPAPGIVPAPVLATPPAGRDPAAILSGAPVLSTPQAPAAFSYLVQTGAYTRAEDAETQRAKLAMQGFTAKVHERDQAGRTVYRVRLGPFDSKAEADALQLKLQGAGVEGQLVRVQKP
jgi:cell division protein FtsN